MKPEDQLLDALALAEGEADEVTQARVEADPTLRVEAEALGLVVARLRSVEPELPPPELRGSILAALEAEAGPARATSWFWRSTRVGLVGAAAAVLIGVGIGGGGLGVSPAPPPLRAGIQLAAWEGPGSGPGALGVGSTVKVPVGARATLDWRGRGPLTLHGGAVAVLEEHAVQLVTGTLISGVDPEDSVGFRVRTEDAEVSVVGTRFRVTYERDRGGTEVEVFEGEVRVEDLRSRLVRILTPALRSLWQAWNIHGEVEERPRPRPPLARKPPPATRPATRPTDAEPPPETSSEATPDPSPQPPAADPTEDPADPETGDAEDEAVASKPGDETEAPEEDEPQDPSYVPADTVEQGF